MLIPRAEFDAALARRNVARDAGGRVLLKGHVWTAFGGEDMEIDGDAVCLIDGHEVRLLDLPLGWECPAILIHAD